MKTISLTKGFVCLVDDADHTRVSAHKWHVHIDQRGRMYAASKKSGHTIYMHRFICKVTDRRVKVDHRDGDGLDNRRENLRICSTAQNSMNQRKHRDGLTSRFKGVFWNKRDKKFQASIKVNGHSHFLGSFGDEIEAARAYNAAALEHFGEFALCNSVN
jgi:hypothetical protein